jgi:hypothetical protein
MVSPTILAAITYTCTDLDGFAVILADLAAAVDRRDSVDALTYLQLIATDYDQPTATALADYLTFTGLFAPEGDDQP